MLKIYDYGIDADAFGYVMGKIATRKTKDGELEEYITRPKYYRSLSAACEGVFKAEVRKVIHEEEMTLNSLVERIDAMHKEFRAMCETVFKEGDQC